MKLFLFLVCSMLASSAWALKLSYIGETSIKTGTKFQDTTIGGISGIDFHEGKLFALSDDRGRINDERFYEFSLEIDKKNKVILEPKAVRYITDLPKSADGKKAGLDPEGLARLPDGSFIVSSEGSNEAKPRIMPRIFQVDKNGKWLLDLPVPARFLPEETGKQTKGIQSNLAFEGLTSLPDGKTVFAAIERALQPEVILNDEAKGDWIRIIKYTKGDKFKIAAEFAYHIDALMQEASPPEFFRGVSEILAVSDTKILVMERGAKISPKKLWTSTVGIYLVDLSKATDISGTDKMDITKITSAAKTQLIDFEKDLTKVRGDKVVDNFEALAWGPKLPDGRKTLLVMTDNNFSKTQITELLVFAVEGE